MRWPSLVLRRKGSGCREETVSSVYKNDYPLFSRFPHNITGLFLEGIREGGGGDGSARCYE